MRSGLNIFSIFEELAFQAPRIMKIMYIIYDDPKNINNFKYYDIGDPFLKSILEEKQPGVNKTDGEEDVVILKVLTEVIKSKKRSYGIIGEELSLLDSLKITRVERELLESFLSEAQQVFNERKSEDAMMPFAPTEFLKETHYKVIIAFGAGGCSGVKNIVNDIENIFAF